MAFEGKLSFSATKLEHITVSPSLAEAMTLSHNQVLLPQVHKFLSALLGYEQQNLKNG
jgi:hypothetical protein